MGGGCWVLEREIPFSRWPGDCQKRRFQYKVTTSGKKKPLAPALTRRGARERGFATRLLACLSLYKKT